MNKLQEFWYCVAPQNDIPLYRGEALDDSVDSTWDDYDEEESKQE